MQQDYLNCGAVMKSNNSLKVFFAAIIICIFVYLIFLSSTIVGSNSKLNTAHKKSKYIGMKYRSSNIKPYYKIKSSKNYNRKSSSFKNAHSNETWIIHDNNVSVMKLPKASLNNTSYSYNLLTIIGDGDIVRVISTKYAYWKEVDLYNHGQVYARGWILSDIVKKAKRIK